MVSVTIRWMRPDEAEQVREMFAILHPKRPVPNPCIFPALVADAGDRLVGYTMFTLAPTEKGYVCYGVDHGVLPKYRRQGIGREMHEERCRLAREAGAIDFVGTVRKGNKPMIRILESAGHLYRSSGAGVDFYIGRI